MFSTFEKIRSLLFCFFLWCDIKVTISAKFGRDHCNINLLVNTVETTTFQFIQVPVVKIVIFEGRPFFAFVFVVDLNFVIN